MNLCECIKGLMVYIKSRQQLFKVKNDIFSYFKVVFEENVVES